MSMPLTQSNSTSHESRQLRRLARKLILIVIAKIALLTLIWWIAIAPHPRPDTRPVAIEHLLAPAASSSAAHKGHP
ncbi:cytochrome oxidase putative small subunit CydP [Dyella subtropica]|uniref:cytochrome oxidase putative small subunit CydP n=1 Tax=Dyella subtropica TaxID=2992127 RepID=UPI0022559EFB|nr:cytochrome oxidase putative small subunit CydP [Dyella subtropica]